MKKFFAMAIMAFVTVAASAQITWKVNAGATYTTFNHCDAKIGLTAGVEGLKMMDDKLGISVGANYTGYNVSPEGSDKVMSAYYINIPVMANYYVAEGLAVKAGLAANILTTAKFDGEDIKDAYKSTCFALPIGVSYEMNDIVLEARYNIGLSKVVKGSDDKASCLAVTVGYKF